MKTVKNLTQETINNQFVNKDIDYAAENLQTAELETRQGNEAENLQASEVENLQEQELEVAPLDAIIGEDAKVDIEEIHSTYGLDGQLIDRIEGTVDGHMAEFIANEEGQIVMGAVDYDDNGKFDLDEMGDLSSMEISELDVIVRDNVGESIVPVEIQDVDLVVNEDDNLALLVSATVDGHDAAFLDDGNGNIVRAQVDYNDDGIIEANETFVIDEGKLTTDQLFALETVPEEEVDPSFVITSIDSSIDGNGNEVDVVSGTYEGHEAFVVDDAEGNLAFGGVDANDNGTFEVDELVSFADTEATIDDLLSVSELDLSSDYSAS